MENGKISIIILNWNGRKDTVDCLTSTEQIDYDNFETILVDNGSTDDSVAVISEKFPNVTLIKNKTNLGFAEGNNVGIRYALSKGTDFVFLLNNDTIVDKNILKAFLKTNKSILGAKPYLYDHPNRIDHLGGMWNKEKGNFDLVAPSFQDDGVSYETIQPVDYVCGCALFAKAEVFQKVGVLEPRFFLYWEESDWCFRAKEIGYQPYICPDAKLLHKVSASFVGGKPHTIYFWWRNRFLWIERNRTKSEKWKLIIKILIPEFLHLFKLRLLKGAQLFVLKKTKSHEDHTKREEKLKGYRAAVTGIWHYLRRRFGNAPKWIYLNKP